MAVIRKTKSKTWLAEVRKFGQYKSKTFTTKLQAQSWAVEMEQTLTPDAIVSGKTLGDAFRRYQKEVLHIPAQPEHPFWFNVNTYSGRS